MNFIDIFLGGVIIFGFARGLMKGLFVEIASLVALVAGLYGAIHFSYFAGDFLVENFPSWEEKYVNLAAFAITFIVILIAVTMAGKLLTKIADFAALGILNKILGGVFGGLKMAVIIGAALVFFERTNNTMAFIEKDKIDDSALYEPVKDVGGFVFAYVLEETDKNSTLDSFKTDTAEQLKKEKEAQEQDLKEIEENEN
ncbi:membrane protein required for colicin V production [Kordia periserrulae]|uniref:Membrane protein required for colicin V production n=1 Tax=Kordia periserrulae TaxID=701523 RepID=A0A2T6BX35_9FLAO|nr:CvpA family protein [Kordia periserrulae]PTX60645.1 membrane protein required for colicin V production [Kordia periserrulae]